MIQNEKTLTYSRTKTTHRNREGRSPSKKIKKISDSLDYRIPHLYIKLSLCDSIYHEHQ